MRELALCVLMLTAGFAGCVGGEEATPADAASANATNTTDAADLDLSPPEIRNGVLHVDVDMPVVTVGFSDEAVEGLDERLGNRSLQPWNIRGFPIVAPLDRAQTMVEEGSAGSTRSTEGPLLAPGPVQTRAKYHVEPTSQALASKLDEEMSGMDEEGQANRLEAFLADALDEEGVDVDPNRPLLVLLDTRDLENAPESWRYAWPDGTNDTVAVFGEREPLLVVDTNALGIEPEQTEALTELVHNATRYRLLEGTTYEPPRAQCHAVTLITAVRRASTVADENATGFVEERIAPERLQTAFENLTGERVHVDSKVLALPEDDPALDAASRGSYSTLRYNTLREYLAANWEDYWVEHGGCKGYISLQLHTDRANTCTIEAMGRCSSGTATYDEDTGYRMAFSWFSPPPAFDGISAASSDGRAQEDPYNGINYLHVHEMGHLFGLNHPHDIPAEQTLAPEPGDPEFPPQITATNGTFQTVWSAMSYASGLNVQDFGTVDQANYERNKAAGQLVAAHEQGLDGEPAFDRALEHVGEYEWARASEAIDPLLTDGTDGNASGTSLPGGSS